MFYDIRKFKNYILCHDLYINSIKYWKIMIIYKSNVLRHHEILKSEFYVINFTNLYTILKNYNYNFPIFDDVYI